jgi:hypothetical protein
MHLAYETRPGNGTSRRIGDHMHLDSRSAERAHGPERAVMKGIPVDPQENGGDADVKQRHGHEFLLTRRP